MTFRRAAAAVCLLLARPLAAAEGPAAVVAGWLTGTFEAKDPAAEGAAVRIVIVSVPKSRLGNGAPVLYREQAGVPKLDEPTLQRFYRLEEDGEVVRLRAFDPKDPVIVRGKWRDPSALALYGTSDVREKPGCEIRLKRVGERWVGATPEATAQIACVSGLRGAVRMSSTLSSSRNEIILWDRGFDAKGTEIWGSPEGGTTFVKKSDSAPVDDNLQERPAGHRAREQEKDSLRGKEEEGETKDKDSLKVEEKEEEKERQPAAQASAALTVGSPSSPSKQYDLAALRVLAGSDRLPVSRLFPGNDVSSTTVVVVTSRSRAASVFSSAEIFSSPSSSSEGPALDVSSSAPRLVAAGGRGLDDVVSIELRSLTPAK